MCKLVLTAGLAARILLAQVSAPPPLVHLYPVAVGLGGQPVTDLTSSDFKITDQGKRETVFFFRGPRTETPTPLGPHEYTNHPGGAVPHPTAILFDLMDETRANWLDTWHNLAKALPSMPSVYVYVLNLDGELVPVRAIASGTPGDLDQIIAAAAGVRKAGIGREGQVMRSYHDLELLSNQLARVSGRGEIVWFTNVMPVTWPLVRCSGDWVDCGRYVPHLAVTLARMGVAVNPLFSSGASDVQIGYDLEQMALLTGGHAYFDKDIGTVLRQIERNALQEYEIAYAPAAPDWDNRCHKIHIDCARKGVKLLARERYYALPDSRSDQERRKELLFMAFENPADATDIELRVSEKPAAGGVHLDVRIDVSDILLREQNGKFVGMATLLVSDRADPGQGVDSRLQRRPVGEPQASAFKLELTQEQLSAKRKEGVVLSIDHALSRSAKTIRVMLIDDGRNAVGSVTFPVQ
jgi:VWFA-related protein